MNKITKRPRRDPLLNFDKPNNQADEIIDIARHMKASAKSHSEETKLMQRAAIGNYHAFEPDEIRAPSARQALERLPPVTRISSWKRELRVSKT